MRSGIGTEEEFGITGFGGILERSAIARFLGDGFAKVVWLAGDIVDC